MSVETTLKALINPLVVGNCHNSFNTTAPPVKPYVVFYEVSGVPVTGVNTDYLGKTRHRYQVDVFADTPEQAKAIALGSVKSAITASSEIQAILVFHSSGQYSETDKTYQYITDYQVWAD